MSKSKIMEETDQATIMKSKLSQLTTGLLVLTVKKEIEEPCYAAIDMMTFEHELIQRRSRYANDLQRTIYEIKLTAELLLEVEEKRHAEYKTYGPEEIINFYSGIFFDLAHQIKDKLFQLIAALIATKPNGKTYKEPKTRGFLNKYGEDLKKIGINDFLNKWNQDDKGPIGVVLRRRTQYHHYLSYLPLNPDFQKVQMSRLMLEPLSVGTLSEYGKLKLTEIGAQSFKNFKEDTSFKQQESIQEMENNIDRISEKLISYYNIPTEPATLTQIGKEYMDYLTSQDITNEASLDKIPSIIKPLIFELVTATKQLEDTLSIYLVGSCGRGDFVPGTSDINIYIITKGITEPLDCKYPLAVTLLSEEGFLSENHKKDRFICWSDGVLLTGKHFEFKATDFPKPSAFLCLLLNRGFIEKLEMLKVEIAKLQKPSVSQLRDYSLRMIKIIMDYDFGVAMSNKPFYTASRKKKMAYTQEAFPDERRTSIVERIYNGGIIMHADFPIFIDTFLENARKTYQKLLDVEAASNKIISD